MTQAYGSISFIVSKEKFLIRVSELCEEKEMV